MEIKHAYETIVIGGGAAGLFFGAAAPAGRDILILEKTKQTGTKLLMSGSGQCNLTHCGSIKEFLLCYGRNGNKIRTCLYRHSNLALCRFMEGLGVSLIEREDGKIFPRSMDAREVRGALLHACARNGVSIRTQAEVTAIRALPQGSGSSSVGSPAQPSCSQASAAAASAIDDATPGAQADGDPAPGEKTQSACAPDLGARFILTLADGTRLACRNLVIAAGGASYPTTGSDGTLLDVLALAPPAGLGLPIVPPRPALTPVCIENYPFADLAGISLRSVGLKIFPKLQSAAADGQNPDMFAKKNKKAAKPQTAVGDLLLTHKNLSGPVILNRSRDVFAGTRLEINFVFPYTVDSMISQIKEIFPGCRKMISAYIGEEYHLPKRFVCRILELIDLKDKPLASLTGSEIRALSGAFAAWPCTVSGIGGYREAMATAGGISLAAVDLSTMGCRTYPGLFFAGEVLDIDGDTGGYNLQFAYASAMAALDGIKGSRAKTYENTQKRGT